MKRKIVMFMGLIGLLGWGITAVSHPTPSYAAPTTDAVVGTGTPASCTETMFNTALATANSGGGTITFNCGGAATITFTSGKVITNADVTIDGGNNVTLNGGNAVRHFYVESNAHLTLQNITLTNGFDNTFGGGSILSLGELTLENTTIRDSNVDSDHSGGAIMAYKPVGITNSLIENNAGGSVGGLFLFGEAADATITGSTFRNNRTINPNYGLGGAITTWDGADLIVRGSTLEQNQAINGGAIYNESANTTMLIEQNTILNNNSVTGDGGGIHNFAGTITLNQVTLSNNTARWGGGIYNNSGDATINNVTISNNNATFGAGLNNRMGTTSLTQVTLSSNTASLGGGAINVWNGNLLLTHATISDNSANYAAGIRSTNSNLTLTHVTFSGNMHEFTRNDVGSAIDHFSTTGVTGVIVKNVIIQGTLGVNCHVASNSTSSIASLGFNLSSDASCPFSQAGDQNNTDPMLMPLADNGGFTQTHMLLQDSPAIDAGQCVSGLTTDQRGLPRLQGLACDIGAVERQPDDSGYFVYLPMVVK